MKIAISQPTFLPWAGYFALIDHVDQFIFLDNVQFVRRSWIQRNKIKIQDNEKFISVPVHKKNKFHQLINKVEIDYNNFDCKELIITLEHNYKKSKFFNLYFDCIKNILEKKFIKLIDLNINLILEITKIIGISTHKKLASDYNIDSNEKNVGLLKKICQIENSKEYISTIGAKKYMNDIEKFENTDIKILFFKYDQNKYSQVGKKFVPNLSVIDLLFNEGPETINILRKNFKIIN